MKTNHSSFLLLSLVLFGAIALCQGGESSLVKNFYKDSCPKAEAVVKDVIWRAVSKNPNLPAKLLRLHAHDCFVRGCEGSVLLDSMRSFKSEKDAPPNRLLFGYEIVESAKDEIEKVCPGVVSCADVLALAARDAVSYQFQRPIWEVLTGRRDGVVSLQSEAIYQLPDPSANYTALVKKYGEKGLSAHDLVVLSGAHTIGTAHCMLFMNRVYNFTGKGDTDPSLDPAYARYLKSKCPARPNFVSTVEMDETPLQFDNNYFVILKQKKGVFSADTALLTDKDSVSIIDKMLDSKAFFDEFGQAMQRLGAVNVLTGEEGEIRKRCNLVN